MRSTARPVPPIRRLLFVRTDRLGETLLNLPAIHALRAVLPAAHLIWLVSPQMQELLAGHPDVDEVVAEPPLPDAWWPRAWVLSRLWRRWHPDTVIISNPTKAYHLAAWLARIPRRVGYRRKWGGLLTDAIPDRKALGSHHEVEYNLDLVKTTLKVSTLSEPCMAVPVGAQEDEAVARRLAVGSNPGDRFVAIHPWTSNPRKQWPPARFRELIDRLAASAAVRPVVIGGAAERAHVEDVLPSPHRAIDLVGALSLKELAALLRHVRLLVSNDSGPVHLAAAVGTPVVALFGTGDPGSRPSRWGPWGAGHTVIQQPLAQLSVDDVHRAVARYLA